jgi:hypothetical protein
MARLALLEAWATMEGGHGATDKDAPWGVTVAEAMDRIADNPRLREALEHFARPGQPLTARTVGNVIRGMRKQSIGGLRFDGRGTYQRSIRWAVIGDLSHAPSEE